VNDANLFTNAQAPAISGIALECFCAGDKSCDKICSNCSIQALTFFVSFKSFNGLVLAMAI
jgi:hypothetical protein